MTSYKKTEVALIQLDSAIEAYFCGSYIVAITLAGASEEILGALCKRRGLENAVEKIANLSPMLKVAPNFSARIAILNKVRNCLKHANDELDDQFSIAEEDPYVMLVRAIANLDILRIESTDAVLKFKSFHKK